MQNFFNTAAANGQVAYFDKGAYIVRNTVNVPKDLKITGELWPLIMANGPNFQDVNNPRVMWKIGNPGESGTVELTDLMFETLGPAPGCIMVEWNIVQASPGAAGMWDAHFRIGGSAGTLTQSAQCAKDPSVNIVAGDPRLTTCTGPFLLLHVTPRGNGYFENVWGWVSDHELDSTDHEQVTIFVGR
jgi:glucan 1,3-beta-glucosidase